MARVSITVIGRGTIDSASLTEDDLLRILSLAREPEPLDTDDARLQETTIPRIYKELGYKVPRRR